MEAKNLKLIARTEEDLRVVSAHLQDSIASVSDIANLEKNKIFLLQLNRFMWKDVENSELELKEALVGGTADLSDKIATLDDSDTDFVAANVVDAIRELQDDLGNRSDITSAVAI